MVARTAFSRSSAVMLRHLVSAVSYVFVSIWFVAMIGVAVTHSGGDWSGGDWLINYQGGFVRRGITGSFFLYLSQVQGLSPIAYVVWVKVLCSGIIAAYLLYRIHARCIGLLEIILLASPWGLMFYVNDPLGAQRKELLLIATLCVYLWVAGQKYESQIHNIILWVVLPLLVLAHEGLLFFLPLFWFADCCIKKSGLDATKSLVKPFSLAFVAFLFALAFKGGPENSIAICRSLVEAGVKESVCGGAVAALSGFELKFNVGYLKAYPIVAALTFVPLFFYAKTKHKGGKAALCLAICILGTFPLYVVAIDWGRWISATALMGLLVLQAMDSRPLKKYSALTYTTASIFAYVYVFNWMIPHFIGQDQRFVYSNNIKWWLSAIADNALAVPGFLK